VGADLGLGGLAAGEATLARRRALARKVAEGSVTGPFQAALEAWSAWVAAEEGPLLGDAPPRLPGDPVPGDELGRMARGELQALVHRDREFEALLANQLVRGLQEERDDEAFLASYRQVAQALESAWREELAGWIVGEEGTLEAAVMVLETLDGPRETAALAAARTRREDPVAPRVRRAWLEALGSDLESREPPCEDRLAALRELGFGGGADATAHSVGLFLRLSSRCPDALAPGDGQVLLAALPWAAEAPAARRAWLAQSRLGGFGEGTGALVKALEQIEPEGPETAEEVRRGLPPPRLGF
jgi:hypothetical protein